MLSTDTIFFLSISDPENIFLREGLLEPRACAGQASAPPLRHSANVFDLLDKYEVQSLWVLRTGSSKSAKPPHSRMANMVARAALADKRAPAYFSMIFHLTMCAMSSLSLPRTAD
jgi:hypothetical protein